MAHRIILGIVYLLAIAVLFADLLVWRV